jgi:hypothetical protein
MKHSATVKAAYKAWRTRIAELRRRSNIAKKAWRTRRGK